MSEPVAKRSFRADRDDAARRLDQAVVRRLADIPGLSRSRVQRWIAEGLVRVDGAAVTRVSSRLGCGSEVEVLLPGARPLRSRPAAQPIPLSVLWEDEHLLAVDKPPGIVVHPTHGHADGTLLNAVLFHLEGTGGSMPGPVGRLDKDTSGVVLFARHPLVHGRLARAMRKQAVEKDYLALAYGPARFPKGRIDRRILRDPEDRRRMTTSRTEGWESSTLYEVLDEPAGLALLRCRLLTGRMHQIRVHLQSEGLPIVGDPVYGEPRWKGLRDPGLAALCRGFPRQALHAWRLAFAHPVTQEPLEIVSPLPADMAGLLAAGGGTLP